MTDIAKEILPINIEEEMKQSYLDYAMSVIVGRALPDVRDGLKPVHRRVLYAMSELGNDWNKPYKKSARVVGDTIGKYHPHGEASIYDALVRMAQPFSMRTPLIDGQGNFGSVDGDSPAAMRYTEVRMARVAHEMLHDLDKNTVDFAPNYDESEHEPQLLPTRVPNLLVNGSAGIAVGMATNIPPHNLSEVVDATVALLDQPALGIDELMHYLPGPDFPTCGIINGADGIKQAYHTGRGVIYVRARAGLEEDEKSGRQRLVVTELPYQVNKARLIEKIADLVKQRKLEGIAELRDESDKDGMRMVIELKRGEQAEVLLNNLYLHTYMTSSFGINLVALVDNRPLLLNLKQILSAFIRHRREIVTRRTRFDLNKARERAHVLEGLAIALTNLDAIINCIRDSANSAAARSALTARNWAAGEIEELLERAADTMLSRTDTAADAPRIREMGHATGLVEGGYRLSGPQAQAILDLRLHRLTALEQHKITEEYQQILRHIEELIQILGNPERLRTVVREELIAVQQQYADSRRTEILKHPIGLETEDMIPRENVVVTLSKVGYIKWHPLDAYPSQHRGGKGRVAATIREADLIKHVVVAHTHDTVLCFSSHGKVYWKRVFELPQATRTARGKPIVNLLPLAANERINAILPLTSCHSGGYLLMATARGLVKKTPLAQFQRPRSTGLIALSLRPDDYLIGVLVTEGRQGLMLASRNGRLIHFDEQQIRPTGRGSQGVRGMRIAADDEIIALMVANPDGMVLSATEYGFGKCTKATAYRQQGRGGRGLLSIRGSERNGRVVSTLLVAPDDEIMLITDSGKLIRMAVSGISVLGRTTQGVRLIRLGDNDLLADVQSIIEADEGGADEGGADEGGADEGGADEGGADEGGADEGGADEGGADEGGADEGSADEGGADEGGADEGGAA